jgi:hypothetical protein
MWTLWLVAVPLWTGLVHGQEHPGLLHDGSRMRHRATQVQVGKITQLRWIDSSTDQPAAVYGRSLLSDGEIFWIDRDDFNTNLTLEAMTDGGIVGSVRFAMAPPSTFNRFENTAAWAMCGNKGRDFFPCPRQTWVTTGSNALVVTPYSGKNGLGTAGEAFSALLVIFEPPAPELSFSLINTDTGQIDESMLTSNIVVSVARTPRINIGLDWTPTSRGWFPNSVQFSYDNGTMTRFDDASPFSAFGDQPLTPSIGTHTLKATVFKRPGLVGVTLSLTIKVVN